MEDTSSAGRLTGFLDLSNCKAVQQEGSEDQIVLSEGGRGEETEEQASSVDTIDWSRVHTEGIYTGR